MRLTFFLLWLAALASQCLAMPLQRRQAQTLFSIVSRFLPGITGQISSSPAQFHPNAYRKTMRLGPFDLPPAKVSVSGSGHGSHMGGSASEGGATWWDALTKLTGASPMDPNGSNILKRIKTPFCDGCSVLMGFTRVVDEQGRLLNASDGVYIHHLGIVDTSKTITRFVSDCGNFVDQVWSPFVGGDLIEHETYYAVANSSFPSGYHVKREDNFIVQGELVNSQNRARKIFVDITYEYLPGEYGNDATQKATFVTTCAKDVASFSVKPNTAGQMESEEFVIKRSGSLITSRSHIHHGVTEIQTLLNGKVICDSVAKYRRDDVGSGSQSQQDPPVEHLAGMNMCFGPIEMKKGDKVKYIAHYDTAKHPARLSAGQAQDLMALVTTTFAPSSSND